MDVPHGMFSVDIDRKLIKVDEFEVCFRGSIVINMILVGF